MNKNFLTCRCGLFNCLLCIKFVRSRVLDQGVLNCFKTQLPFVLLYTFKHYDMGLTHSNVQSNVSFLKSSHSNVWLFNSSHLNVVKLEVFSQKTQFFFILAHVSKYNRCVYLNSFSLDLLKQEQIMRQGTNPNCNLTTVHTTIVLYYIFMPLMAQLLFQGIS